MITFEGALAVPRVRRSGSDPAGQLGVLDLPLGAAQPDEATFTRACSSTLPTRSRKSMDNGSADPGSTAGGGKPDLPNVGFTAQGNAFDTSANRAVSDFDRPHRFSVSFVYDIPSFGSKSKFLTGWQSLGLRPGTVRIALLDLLAEVTVANSCAILQSPTRFGRPLSSGVWPAESCAARSTNCSQTGSDPTEQAFNPAALCSPLSLAGGYPNNRGFGNLGRNILRGLQPETIRHRTVEEYEDSPNASDSNFAGTFSMSLNNVNFATPNNVIGEAGTDFGKITDTIGGPRVMQFGMKLKF